MSDGNLPKYAIPRKGKSDVWMPLYVADYLADTTHLSTEQHGAYLLLIMSAWKRGGRVPADDRQLAAITGLTLAAWRKHKPLILPMFTPDGPDLIHGRVVSELQAAKSHSERRRAAGAKGAQNRWQSDSKAIANEWQNDRPSEGEGEGEGPIQEVSYTSTVGHARIRGGSL